MSLSKSQINGDETNINYNYTCPRPPLKINKDSHAIQKSSSVHVVEKNNIKNQNSCSKRQPVIIYTHPPKIIYAKACEFMDIVQKLTGLEKPTVDVDHEKTIKVDINHDVKSNYINYNGTGPESDEKFVGDGSNSSISSQPIMSNPYMVDNIPPPVEFFSSSMPNYVLQSSTSSNMANSISPMYMDMMNNGFPEYY